MRRLPFAVASRGTPLKHGRGVSMVARHWAKRKVIYPWMSKPASVFDFGLSPEQERHAAELHKTVRVYDGLMECTWYPGMIENILAGGPKVGGSLSIGNSGLERMTGDREHLAPSPDRWWTYETLVRDLAYVRAACAESGGKIRLCTSAAELDSAYEAGAVAATLDIQNSNFIGPDFDRLETVYWLGLRRIQMTYNDANYAGHGCMEDVDGGLTKWGRRLVGAMNDLGMVVDTGRLRVGPGTANLRRSSKPPKPPGGPSCAPTPGSRPSALATRALKPRKQSGLLQMQVASSALSVSPPPSTTATFARWATL